MDHKVEIEELKEKNTALESRIADLERLLAYGPKLSMRQLAEDRMRRGKVALDEHNNRIKKGGRRT